MTVSRPGWARDAGRVAEIVARYPERRSAIMPLLHLAQEERGYIATDDVQAIAGILGLTPAEVESVSSFYALYRPQREGRYVITVCANLACVLAGARRLVQHLEQRLGIRAGETTGDGVFTLKVTGECLAACDQAPVMQINGRFVHRAVPERADAVLEALRQGVPLEELADRAALPEEEYRPTGVGEAAGGRGTRGAGV